VFFVDC
jgi:hypothetical protein